MLKGESQVSESKLQSKDYRGDVWKDLEVDDNVYVIALFAFRQNLK